jgi:hypothetical protein
MSYESAVLIRQYRAMLANFREILGCAENDQDINIPFRSTGTFDGIRSLCIDGEKKFSRIKRNYGEQDLYAPLLHVIIRSFRNHLSSTELKNLELTLNKKDSMELGFEYLMPICKHGINDVCTKDFYQNVRLGIAWMLSQNKEFASEFETAKSAGIHGILKLYSRALGIIIHAYDIDKKPEVKKMKKRDPNDDDDDYDDNENAGEDDDADNSSKVSSISTRGVYAGGDRGVAVIGIKKVGQLIMCVSIEPEEKINNHISVGDNFFSDREESKRITKLAAKATLKTAVLKEAGKKKHRKGEEDDDDNQEQKDEDNEKDEDNDEEEKKVVKSSSVYSTESKYINGGSYNDYITELSVSVNDLVPKQEKTFKINPPCEFPFVRYKVQK